MAKPDDFICFKYILYDEHQVADNITMCDDEMCRLLR